MNYTYQVKMSNGCWDTITVRAGSETEAEMKIRQMGYTFYTLIGKG